ncbi:MAG: insulinase family protein [Pseudomonadota bacterium]|nr:MAG: insulinase family protein [Pseudomonadota bacterium]
MNHTLFAALAVLVFTAGCTGSTVKETQLANGLRVIVKGDHRSPVVVSQIWYRIGAIDEPDGITGISHVLEHMMFKGTERLKPNEFSRIIAANGGRENAFTGRDYTAYFQQLERSRLPIAFELEAERMRNLTLDAAEFAKEINVVMEERRLRVEDKPESQLRERFMATAYQKHPYRHPIIGWMPDLEKMTIDDLRDWYGRWYTPKNATLVVVGDVQAKEVFALAEKHFGSIKDGPIRPTTIAAEPPQTEERRTRLSVPAEVPSIMIGYHTPVIGKADKDWQPYALSVLNGILDGGNSARFETELVRGQKLAASIHAEYDMIARGTSQFMIYATPAPGRSVAELEAAIVAQIERIQRELASEEELKRVKAQVVARDVFQRDSVFYQAMQIGMLATTGLDWRLIEKNVERTNAVTAEQVRQVAKAYLQPSNRTVALLDPQPSDSRKRRPASGGNVHAR